MGCRVLCGLVISSRAMGVGMFDGAAVEQETQDFEIQVTTVLLSPASQSRASLRDWPSRCSPALTRGGVVMRCCAARAARDPTACVRLAFEACVIGPKGGPLG